MDIPKLIKYWTPVVIWCVVIFSFSSMQVGSASEFYWKDFVVKKTAHLIEYGILATLIYRALINNNFSKNKAAMLAILLCFIYGLTDEFHQSFTPGRGPKFTDALIDTFGATIAVMGLIFNLNRLPKSIQNLYKYLEINI